MDIITTMKQFSDQESCLLYIEEQRWHGEVCCPRCGSVNVGRRKNLIEKGWDCYDCRSSFSATAGTLFHGTKIPLPKWFLAITMISNAKKSISSHQIARELDMNQKSAWHMVMRIRQYMVEDDPLLKGIVEADETYIGGKPRGNNRGKRGRGTNKAPVVGIVERGGRAVAKHTPTVSAEDMKCFIIPNIAPEETVMMTDQFPAYNFLR